MFIKKEKGTMQYESVSEIKRKRKNKIWNIECERVERGEDNNAM